MMVADTSVPLTVGSIGNLAELGALDSDHTPQFDVLEIRLDGIGREEIDDAHWLALRVKSWGMPILITVRHVSEGGINSLTAEERAARLRRFSDVAAYFDIEIAHYAELKEVAKELQAKQLKMVLSYHRFDGFPEDLSEQLELALSYGADIPKFAVMLHHTSDLERCARFLRESPRPVSLMGMGALAPVSRVLCAQLGSVLNYGYLGSTPTAPGQWSAGLLKQAIQHSQPLELDD